MDGAAPVETDPLAAALRPIVGNPRFLEAAGASAAGAIAHYLTHPRMRRYSRDRGSYLVSLAAIYLDATPQGLTAKRLKALCVDTGVCSAGRAAALLAYMRGRGDLVAVEHDGDRRVRFLAPGAAFLAFQRARFRVEFAALAVLLPDGGATLGAFDDGDLFRRYLAASADLLLAGFGRVPDEHTRVINIFAERDAGLLMLFKLIENDGFFTGTPFRISVSAIAGGLGVSRVHILDLLADTTAQGLIRWRRDTREITIGPKVADAMRRFFGVMFLFMGRNLAGL